MKRALKWVGIVVSALVGLLLVSGLAVSLPTFVSVARDIRAAEPLDAYPPLLIKAVLVAEDPDFLTRSRWGSFRGPVTWTAPSLTTHLVRVLFFRNGGHGLIKEFLVYSEVELTQPRDKILSAYLSSVWLGGTAEQPVQGFDQAASFYFGKDMKDLSVAEYALLAGLPKSPSRYSPVKHPEDALERRNHLLQLLRDNGTISEPQFAEASASPIAGPNPALQPTVSPSAPLPSQAPPARRG